MQRANEPNRGWQTFWAEIAGLFAAGWAAGLRLFLCIGNIHDFDGIGRDLNDGESVAEQTTLDNLDGFRGRECRDIIKTDHALHEVIPDDFELRTGSVMIENITHVDMPTTGS